MLIKPGTVLSAVFSPGGRQAFGAEMKAVVGWSVTGEPKCYQTGQSGLIAVLSSVKSQKKF